MKIDEMYNRGANDYRGYVVDEIVDKIVNEFTTEDNNNLPSRKELVDAAREELSDLLVDIVDDAQRKIEEHIYNQARR